MAQALECPACGARHPLDTLPSTRTFRCERCGQTLKVPEAVAASRPLEPPPRRGGAAPSTGPRVSATAAATTAAPPGAPPRAPAPPDQNGGGAAPARAGRVRKVRWYWRVLAWIAAVPLGLLLTAWPALHFDLLKKDDLLDVFVGEGSSRYVRLLVFAGAWALVTALLVSLFVEGGRWLAQRRKERRSAAPPPGRPVARTAPPA